MLIVILGSVFSISNTWKIKISKVLKRLKIVIGTTIKCTLNKKNNIYIWATEMCFRHLVYVLDF